VIVGEELKLELSDSKKEELIKEYISIRDLYEDLASCIQGELKASLDSKNISYSSVDSRTKSVDSFIEKVQRKGYVNPLEEIEDLCGVRVICYYPDEIEQICSVLSEDYDVKQKENTQSRLQPHEFGYRSTHLIVTLKPSWLQTPRYGKLENLKAEVQVRTILMHAWAEIEHKIAYKSTEQVPDQFKRKLSVLSAKFEEADEQFEDLRRGLLEYKKSIFEKSLEGVGAFSMHDLNLDSLQGFLDAAFPTRAGSKMHTAVLLEEMVRSDLKMKDLVEAYQMLEPIIPEMEATHMSEKVNFTSWAQIGVAISLLEAYNQKYYVERYRRMANSEYWIDSVGKMKKVVDNFLKKNKK
jgi:putative GTP pyrophosphokinase